jgi:hypothetical protein
MPRTENETRQSQFRLLAETITDLDLIAAHLAAQTGLRATRAAAVRYAAREVAKKIRKNLGKKD